jgi:hypothetical protein
MKYLISTFAAILAANVVYEFILSTFAFVFSGLDVFIIILLAIAMLLGAVIFTLSHKVIGNVLMVFSMSLLMFTDFPLWGTLLFASFLIVFIHLISTFHGRKKPQTSS